MLDDVLVLGERARRYAHSRSRFFAGVEVFLHFRQKWRKCFAPTRRGAAVLLLVLLPLLGDDVLELKGELGLLGDRQVPPAELVADEPRFGGITLPCQQRATQVLI